jgi:hypothetical protein
LKTSSKFWIEMLDLNDIALSRGGTILRPAPLVPRTQSAATIATCENALKSSFVAIDDVGHQDRGQVAGLTHRSPLGVATLAKMSAPVWLF